MPEKRHRSDPLLGKTKAQKKRTQSPFSVCLREPPAKSPLEISTTGGTRHPRAMEWGTPSHQRFRKGVGGQRGGWREEILPAQRFRHLFWTLFPISPLGEGRHNSGEQLLLHFGALSVANPLPPHPLQGTEIRLPPPPPREQKKEKSSEGNSDSIHPYGRYGNAGKTSKTISTIAILWPVKAILLLVLLSSRNL